MERHLPGLVFLGSFVFIIALAMVTPDEEWLPVLVYLPLLFFLSLVSFKIFIKPVDLTFPAAFFILTLLAKLVGSIARYWMLFELYNGSGDAMIYYRGGQYLAPFFQEFDFSVLDHFSVHSERTTNLAIIVGFIYTILPASLLGGYFFFATLALIGAVLFYSAFRLVFPAAPPLLYRLIVFFLPSILFWPSSLGKDAWLFFSSGIAAYGLAQYYRRGRLTGLLVTALGLLCMIPIRPHFAAFIVVAAALAYLGTLRRMGAQQSSLVWILGGGVIVGLALFILPSSQEMLGINELSMEEIQASYEDVQGMTFQGGSSYQMGSIFSPTGLAWGMITVLFRPFPWEAHNAQSMVSALETFVWLALVWFRRRVLWGHLVNLRSDPWVAFLVIYSLILILAFSSFGNFGILARQRVLLLPFLWMLFI